MAALLTGLSKPQEFGTYARIGFFATLLELLVATSAFWAHRRSKKSGTGQPEELTKPAHVLAQVVGEACLKEIRGRGLRFPLPLQLRWRPLPVPRSAQGSVAPGALDVDGDPPSASALVDAFGTLSDRRLLVLGEAGAGKSTLALLFTLAALRQPAMAKRLLPSKSAKAVVPVLLSLATWRPPRESLRDFVIRRTSQQYPDLLGRAGVDEAAVGRLFDEGWILPVLDGLDELPERLVPSAIAKLNDLVQPGDQPVLVTCRRADYERATTSAEALTHTHVVVLEAVPVDDAVAYLTGGDADGGRWAAVVDRMRAEPAGALASALSTPLMASVARTVYASPTSDPGELCRFTTVEGVEGHLFGRLLPGTYRGGEDGRGRRQPLSILAYYLRPDLAWWELVLAVPPLVIAAAVMVASVTLGAVAGLVLQVSGAGGERVVLDGLVAGLALGVAAGTSATRTVIHHRRADTRRASGLGVVAAAARDSLAFAAVVGGAQVVAAGPSGVAAQGPGIVGATTFAGLAGLAVGLLTNGLGAGRRLVPSRTRVRGRDLVPWLAGGVGTALAVGLPMSVVFGFVAGVQYGALNGVSTALTTAAVASLGLGVPIGVGRWIASPDPDQDPPSPAATIRADRIALFVAASTSGLAIAAAAALMMPVVEALALDAFPPVSPLWSAVCCGSVAFAVVVCGSGSPWFGYVVARAWFAIARCPLPWDLIRYLDAASEDQLVRRRGAVYQFRHARLRAYLSGADLAWSPAPVWLVSPPARVAVRARDAGGPVRGWTTAGRALVSGLASALLVAGFGYVAVPQLRGFVDRTESREADWYARNLVRAADAVQPTDPDRALRLRIAAAAVDSDSGAVNDLVQFLRMRLVAQPIFWTRANRFLSAGQWAVVLDTRGNVTAWDLRARQPVPVAVAGGVHDVLAVGATGWVVLVDQKRAARMVRLAPGGGPAPIALGGDPQSVRVIGTSGWAVVEQRGRVTAWQLSRPRPQPVVLAESGGRAHPVGASGWVVVIAGGIATAWHAGPDGIRPTVLGHRVDGVRADRHTIAELTSVDGAPLSRWDLADGRAMDLSPVAWTMSSAPYSSHDGRWIYADQAGGGVRAWDMSARPPRPVVLPAGRVLVPGPDSWVVTAGAGGQAVAWNVSTTPPASVSLDRSVIGAEPGPGGWTVLDAGGGRRVAWDLAAKPPRRISLGTDLEKVEVRGRWIIADRAGTAHAVAWDLDPPVPREVPLGPPVADALLAENGTWAVVGHTDDTAENLVAVWDADQLGAGLPAGAESPIAFACGLVGRGLTASEWARHAPEAEFRQTCPA